MKTKQDNTKIGPDMVIGKQPANIIVVLMQIKLIVKTYIRFSFQLDNKVDGSFSLFTYLFSNKHVTYAITRIM